MDTNKVLFVHYNSHSTGSAQHRIITLVRHVAQSHSVLVALPAPGPVGELLKDEGIDVEYRAFHDNHGLCAYFWHMLSFMIFCKRRKIKLIHLLDHVWWKPAELLAARLLRLPFISMVTFNRPADAKNGAIRWAYKIVANSKNCADDFSKEGLGARTQVIHNAIDSEPYALAKKIRQELYKEPVGLLLGYVGVLHPIKGIDTLLHAIASLDKELASYALVIVGPEKQEGYLRELQVLAERLEISKQVHFAGYRSDIPSVMKSLDIAVVPSRHEPFGFVTIEAGAAATPVVASAVGGIPEIIRDGIDGLLVPADDAAALHDAILQLARAAEKRKEMGARFQARVAKEFSEARMLAQWEAIYKELFPRQ